MAAKSKYTPIVRNAILTALRHGVPRTHAVAAAGIVYETFRSWICKTEPDFKPAFLANVEKAEADCVAARVRTIIKASKKTWTAAAWWLERRYPNDFALKTHLSGADGGPIPVLLIPTVSSTETLIPELSINGRNR